MFNEDCLSRGSLLLTVELCYFFFLIYCYCGNVKCGSIAWIHSYISNFIRQGTVARFHRKEKPICFSKCMTIKRHFKFLPHDVERISVPSCCSQCWWEVSCVCGHASPTGLWGGIWNSHGHSHSGSDTLELHVHVQGPLCYLHKTVCWRR